MLSQESPEKVRTTLYFENPTYREFKQICKREGEAVSGKIEDFMKRYIAAHSEGNPQLRLEKFTGQVKGKTCFFCQGRFPVLKKVQFISGLTAGVCENCFVEKSKPPYGTVKRVLGAIT